MFIAKSFHRTFMLALGLLFSPLAILAQKPGWTPPNPAAFTFNNNVIAVVKFDGTLSTSSGDTIAFFVGNQLRGLAVPTEVGPTIRHFATVYSNLASEQIQIRVYHAATNKVYVAQNSLSFMAQTPVGDLDTPFEALVYSSGDAPISIDSISENYTIKNVPFDSINLLPFLNQPDPDPVTWSVPTHPDLVATITGNILKVTPRTGFVGTATLQVKATEQTANAYFATRNVIFHVLETPVKPGWDSIPGQGIMKGRNFQNFNLADYENKYQGSCLEFDYRPVMEAASPPQAAPGWQVTGTFLTNMTIVAKPVYTPKYAFTHEGDTLAAFIGGQLRGVAVPQVINGQVSFFLVIGSDQSGGDITIQFYSGALKRKFTAPIKIPYVASGVQGSVDIPLLVDFSPILPTVASNGAVQIQVRDTAWIGEIDFYFIARDCSIPQVGSASRPFLESGTYAPFCITADTSNLFTYYKDEDGDSYGNAAKIQTICDPQAPINYVTNKLDCDDSDDAIRPLPTVAAVQDQTLCTGVATTAINFLRGTNGVNSTSSKTVYNWINNNTAIGLAASGSGNIASFTALNTKSVRDTARIIVTPELNGCSGPKDTFLIIVKPRPNVVATADQTLCHATMSTAVSFTGLVSQTVYSWTNNNTDIGLAASGTGNITAFSVQNTKSARDTARIIVSPAADGCTGTPDTFLVIGKPRPSAIVNLKPFMCQDSIVKFTTTIQGGLAPYGSYTWNQLPGLQPGSVQVTNNLDGTANIKGGFPGQVFVTFNLVDADGCSLLSDATGNFIVEDCSIKRLEDGLPGLNIGDPCKCRSNGEFDETVWVQPTLPGQTWTVVSISAFIPGGSAPLQIAVDSLLKPVQQTPSLHIHKIDFIHKDSSGFQITVEGPNAVGTLGNIQLSIDNICYYPDLTLQGLPAVISPNSPPFEITGSRLNLNPLTGAVGERDTMRLNGQVVRVGQSPPSKLELRPSLFQQGTNTLRYTYDAGAPTDSLLTDPGCTVELIRNFELANCGCTDDVKVTLNANTCGYVLKASDIVKGNCGNATVRVMDKNPLNQDTIDCAGVWTYGLFDGLGNLICWGKVTAEDKSAPVLTTVFGRCGRTVQAAPLPAPPNGIDPATLVWRDTFLCTDVQAIFNEEKSWNPNAGYLYYAGYPKFHDACDYNAQCDCRTDIKVNDQLAYLPCNTVKQDQVWAKITRTFIARDCYGNRTTVVQEIFLVRPLVRTNVLPAELVIRGGICSSGDSALIKAFLSGDYPDMYRGTAQPKYIFNDPYACGPATYTYFREAVQAGKSTKALECNLSFDWQNLGTFEVCNDGLKMQVVIKSADWCTGVSTPLDTVWLKWIDDEPPTIVPNSDKPVVISSGPGSCKAEIGVDTAGLRAFFGVVVKDGCGPVELNVEVWSCGDSINGVFILGGKSWRKVPYPVRRKDGRLVMEELPLGRHYLYITANDRCYNSAERWIPFTVEDRIAPSTQCKDKIQASLTNTRIGSGAGAVFAGYARIQLGDIVSGVSDNCGGTDWVRMRRQIPLAAGSTNRAAKPYEDYLIALGYDSDANNQITTEDGYDWNRDNNISANLFERFVVENGKLFTPMLDWAEFFCSDTGSPGAGVEIWARDKAYSVTDSCGPLVVTGRAPAPGFGPVVSAQSGGNMNRCWAEIVLEDKVAPTFLLPFAAEIACTERDLVDALSIARTLDVRGAEYLALENRIFGSRGKGTFEIISGAECAQLEARVAIAPELKCDAGKVTLRYTVRKTIKPGQIFDYNAGTVTVTIRLVHAYNLKFPADETRTCGGTVDTVNVLDGGELGCDVLAVLVQDKRYAGTSGSAECYKINRTFTVINWCQYVERCGEPNQWAIVVPRDPDGNGTFGNQGGVNVLVRDEFGGDIPGGRQNIFTPGTGLRVGPGDDGWEEIYYEDLSKDLVPQAGEWISTRGNGARELRYDNPSQTPCPQFDALNPGNEHFAWIFTQQIAVEDGEKPKVEKPAAALPFYVDKNTCKGIVRFAFRAQDNCGATEIQQVPGTSGTLALERVRIRLNNSGLEEIGTYGSVSPGQLLSGDNKGTGVWEFSGTNLPEGDHALAIVVRDDCGNLSETTEIRFTVRDSNGIAPICINGLGTSLTAGGQGNIARATVRALDFVASPVYDCNGQGPEVNAEGKKLIKRYFLVKDVNGDRKWGLQDGLDDKGIPLAPADTVSFTCVDLGEDTVRTVPVRLYTRDERGNWGWCESFVTLKDPSRTCSGFIAKIARVSGTVATTAKGMAPGVEMELSGNGNMRLMTDGQGAFIFSNLLQGYDYTLTPQLDKDYLNGVSTLDLVAMTRHILGNQPLTTPYQYIAADINNSRSITTLDMIQLRKLILGLDSRFPNNASWRFVDAAHKFVKANNPWTGPIPEVININDLAGDVDANFIAIKIGDLNGSAGTVSQVRNAGTFKITAEDRPLKAGEEYRMVFRGMLQDIEGYQFTTSFDRNAFEWVGLDYGFAGEGHFGVFEEAGVVTTSWNRMDNVQSKLGETPLFALILRAKRDLATLNGLIAIGDRITPAEAYGTQGEPFKVEFGLQGVPMAQGQPMVYQNIPNPFAGETLIGFYLPDGGEAQLRVSDLQGRLLKHIKGQFEAGYGQFRLKSTGLPPGILQYTLTCGTFSATRRMIVVH